MKIGFFGLLGLLFIALKLTNHIDWSWWVVLLPVYFPLALVGFLLAMSGICSLVLYLMETPAQRKLRRAIHNFEITYKRERK